MSTPAPHPYRSRLPRLRGAGEAVRRARLTVVPSVRSRAPRVPFVTLVTLILVTGVVGLLLFNTSMQQAAFTSHALEEQEKVLSAKEQQLVMELDDLRDPQHLAKSARAAGMVDPTAPCFLREGGSSVQGNCVPATQQGQLSLRAEAPVKPSVLEPDPIRVPATVPTEQQPQQQPQQQTQQTGQQQTGQQDGAGPQQGGATGNDDAARGQGSPGSTTARGTNE